MASTNKTENIGLSLWELNDKPGMEDFNADNRKLEEALTELTAKESKRNLSLLTGFTAREDAENYYWVTATGQVSLIACIAKADGTPFEPGETQIGMMPEDARPTKLAYFPITGANSNSRHTVAGYGLIYPTGTIAVNIRATDTKPESLYVNAAFIAKE